MSIINRIARLEDRLLVSANRDGSCRHCTGRERELGKVVVEHDPPRDEDGVDRVAGRRPNPPPTPCPACGRDMNVTIVVRRVPIEEWAAGRGGPPSTAG
ncbi:MAG TPA: hypothetical protein PKE29_16710 [Phycisphaerales bacterium]|nr:hypothetical protein [Phycisphaerales bacterium]